MYENNTEEKRFKILRDKIEKVEITSFRARYS
jgi:hypothetical protein